jgi:ribonuclease VapC
MTTRVLDSWAIMAFFGGEPSAPDVKKILLHAENGGVRLLMSVINWGEIYYSIMQKGSQAEAEEIVREIAGMPIDIVGVADDLALARQAAIFKATKRMSYADCFAAALAKHRNAELVTGDHEFKEVEKDIKIHWLA